MDDRGSIVLGWLTKLVVLMSLLGLLAFDGIALVSGHFTASDHATTAARDAADVYRSTHDVQASYNAAAAAVALDGDTIEADTFRVAANGHVMLRLHREATTVWLHRIGPLKKYVDVTAEGVGAPAP